MTTERDHYETPPRGLLFPAELRGREVSCRVLGLMIEAARRSSIPLERLVEGAGVTVEHLLKPSERISWASFVTIMGNAGRLWTDDELRTIGSATLDHPLLVPFAVVGRLLYTVPEFYLWVMGPNGPAQRFFASADVWVGEVAPGVVICETRMRPGYAPCRENYLVVQGTLEGMSRALGYGPAQVELELIEDGARFHVRVPVRGGVLGWLRRGIGWLVAARWAGRELREAHEALNVKYVELQHEIAARSAAEQAQADAHSRMVRILDALPIGCLVHDPAGRVTYWNSATERLFGRRVTEEADIRPLISAGVEGDDPLSARGPVRRDGIAADGRPCRIEWTHTQLETDDGLLGYVSTCVDVSERERLEDRLIQAQKLETVGRLAGGIAHDFNNLLTVVLASSELIERSIGRDNPLRVDVEQIQRAAGRGAELTRQLLAFGRRQVLRPDVLDLDRVIAGVSAMVRRLIREDIDLQVVAGTSVGAVRADPSQIERVVVNLVVNASDAMPEGGRLTIRTSNADIDAMTIRGRHEIPPGHYVLLSVSDSGVGMADDTLAQVFEPFFSTKTGGGGLGLSTVYGIVRQSGGHVAVSSAPGAGSTFEVYLPRVEAVAGALPAPQPPPRVQEGTETVLVVEDDDAIRRLACVVLRTRGYTVLQAAHGPEALGVSDGHPDAIDLLLTDIVMPGMTGVELAHRLVDVRPDIRVLYMSGYAPNDVLDGNLGPRAEFQPKPFTAATLAARVRALLDRP